MWKTHLQTGQIPKPRLKIAESSHDAGWGGAREQGEKAEGPPTCRPRQTLAGSPPTSPSGTVPSTDRPNGSPKAVWSLSISAYPDWGHLCRSLSPQEEVGQSKAPVSCHCQVNSLKLNQTLSSKPNSFKSPVPGETNCCSFGRLCAQALPSCGNLQNKAFKVSPPRRRAHPRWLSLSFQKELLG